MRLPVTLQARAAGGVQRRLQAGRHRWSAPVRAVLLLLALFAGGGSSSLLAQPLIEETGEEIEIPIAYGGTVEVLLGEPASIVLSARSTTQKPVEFLIRAEPTHGELTEPKRIPGKNHQVTVTYRAKLDSLSESDFFTYAVRHEGGGVSKEARVNLVLKRPTAKVELSRAELDFGKVFVGDERERTVSIKNVGTAELVTTVIGKAPVSVRGSNELRIPVGESRKLTLLYRPLSLGPLDTGLKIGDKTLLVKGAALSPWAVLPADKAEFVWDPETDRRSSRVELQNLSQAPLMIRIASPLRVRTQTEVRLGPGATVPLELTILSTDLEALDDTLGLEPVVGGIRSSEFARSIRLIASAVPARLAIKGLDRGDSVFLGTAKEGEELPEREIEVSNTGGKPAILTWSHKGAFEFKAAQASSLKPGQSLKGLVRCVATTSGIKNGLLSLVLGSDKRDIGLAANFIARSGPATRMPDATQVVPRTGIGTIDQRMGIAGATLSAVNVSTVAWQETDSLPSAGPFVLDDKTSDSLTVSWGRPEGGDHEYVLEFYKLGRNPETREVSTFWVPYEKVEFSEQGGRVRLLIKDLNEQAVYKMRVRTVDRKRGFSSKPSGAFILQTEGYSWFWTWGIYVIAPIALVILIILFRRWKAARDARGPGHRMGL